MLTVHPFLHMDNDFFDNFYYIDPENFVARNKKVVLEKRIQNIKVCICPPVLRALSIGPPMRTHTHTLRLHTHTHAHGSRSKYARKHAHAHTHSHIHKCTHTQIHAHTLCTPTGAEETN